MLWTYGPTGKEANTKGTIDVSTGVTRHANPAWGRGKEGKWECNL
jgi:hypothetical protein